MKYVFLGLAICLEVVGSSFLLKSIGFTKLIPSMVTVLAFVSCFYFFSQALKAIPLGIAYAIWAGLGIVLTSIVSVVVFKQKLDTAAMVGMGFIIMGVIIINAFSKSATH
ncbi:MAG: DMT family transporter [Sphingobacteriaceae bacterium]